jgi:hypothetical protein
LTLLDRLRTDTVTALKGGDRPRAAALRLVTSEVQRAHKEAGGGEVDELAVLQRERKRRVEAAVAYRDAGREDLAAAEEGEVAIVDEYLPDQLSDTELDALVGDAVAEAGATSPRDLGRVMSIVMPLAAGRADGRRVSTAARRVLGGL